MLDQVEKSSPFCSGNHDAIAIKTTPTLTRPMNAPYIGHMFRVQRAASNMAATTTPVSVEQTPPSKPNAAVPVVFDISKPPVIDGFTPLPRPKEEGFKDKFIRKTKENPFVPIGCLGTAGALTYGLVAFKHGKTRQSQLLMRARIFAQGFTVVAIVVGVVATALKPKQ